MASPVSGNRTLHAAKRNRKDEFYTQLTDIEKELRHYKQHFAGATVYCNCDDPYESNFFKYFAMNFDFLGLKRLITTCYIGSSVRGEQMSFDNMAGLKGSNPQAFALDIRQVGDRNDDGAVSLADVEWLLHNDANTTRPLEGDGDFRSAECIELLKEADIVVTNPPFSLFKEYLAQLIEHDKQFLMLGDQNAVSYKETYSLIQSGRLWLGHDNGGTKWFQVPDDYDIKTEARKRTHNGIKYFSMGRIWWFTNMDHSKRHKPLPLHARYSPEHYPHYDNYNAINVDKVAEIPDDWDGAIGVPITFLDKWCPEQFKIVRFRKGDDNRDLRIGDKEPYFRILIQRMRAV